MTRWQFILIAIGCCAMAFSYGYSIAPLTPAEKVYVPVCGALPTHLKLSPISLTDLHKKGR